GQADADGEGHGAVGDALTERRGFGELRVQVMGEEIAAVAGVDDEIGLGDGPAGGGAGGADDVVFVVERLFHGGVLPERVGRARALTSASSVESSLSKGARARGWSSTRSI